MESPSEPRPSIVDELVRGLAEGGKLVDQGEFTLDEAAAREKLRRFRLQEPEMWVLAAVRAAAWAGAPRVSYRGGNDSCLEIPSLALSRAELEHLFANALKDAASQSGVQRVRASTLRHLAVAVQAALGSDARRVVIESRASETICLRVEADQHDVEIRAGSEQQAALPSVLIRVERDGLLAARSRREIEVLEDMARFARFPIEVDGADIDRLTAERLPEHPAEGTVRFKAERGDIEGYCTRSELLPATARGRIHYVYKGVVLATSPLADRGYGAVVYGDFRSDLSATTIRVDERFRAARAAAQQALEDCRRAASELRVPGPDPVLPTRQRWIALAAVPLVPLLLVASLWLWAVTDRRRSAHTATARWTECRDAPSTCIPNAEHHRACADGTGRDCESIHRSEHIERAMNLFVRACRHGVREGCELGLEALVAWYGPSALSGGFGRKLRAAGCEHGFVEDCEALAEILTYECVTMYRGCVAAREAAERACTLGGAEPCTAGAELCQRLAERLEDLGDYPWNDVYDQRGDYEELRTLVEACQGAVEGS